MAKDFKEMASAIVENIGGKGNITKLQHCVTRLRFELRDKGKINEEALKGITGVLGTKWAGEQLQVIIGPDVDQAYDAVCAFTGIKATAVVPADDDDKKVDKSNMTVAERISDFMKPLVDCIIPLMGIFIATGLVKGILSALSVISIVPTDSSTYMFLYAIGDCMLYFYPIFFGFSAGKVFNTNPYMAATIGAALVYPTITAAQAAGDPVTLFGIPVQLVSYTASLLPVFFATIVAARLEHFFSKHVPNVVKYMLPSFLTLIIIVPLTFIVIGPIMTVISNVIGSAITSVWNFAPALGGFLIGGFWQVLVMTGLHGGTTPFVLELFFQNGYDILGVCVTCSMIALAGAALAMWVASKKASLKEASFSAMISALLGVTEPAIYGVALPHLKAFAAVIIGGGAGGAVGAALGTKIFGFGGNALLQLPFTLSSDGFMNTVFWIISILIAFIVAFVLTYILCKKDLEKD